MSFLESDPQWLHKQEALKKSNNNPGARQAFRTRLPDRIWAAVSFKPVAGAPSVLPPSSSLPPTSAHFSITDAPAELSTNGPATSLLPAATLLPDGDIDYAAACPSVDPVRLRRHPLPAGFPTLDPRGVMGLNAIQRREAKSFTLPGAP